MDPAIPYWLMSIGTSQVVAFVSMMCVASAGVARLVWMHEDPDKYGFGTAVLEKAMVKLLKEQEKSNKHLERLLMITLWEARDRSPDNFPEWANRILTEELLE